ncbi:MAG: HPr family phosphocarrier protein [candidate division Zixibacteria bacterium]|jgi:phosphocarrier protein|nr:HPr family phosphocarrier protein [candidate division Zixibacteria bacterium]
MIEKIITVTNKLGLHARPSAKVVQTAAQFKSEISLSKGTMTINAKSMLGVMALAAEFGSNLILRVEGEDEKDAAREIVKLFRQKFKDAY